MQIDVNTILEHNVCFTTLLQQGELLLAAAHQGLFVLCLPLEVEGCKEKLMGIKDHCMTKFNKHPQDHVIHILSYSALFTYVIHINVVSKGVSINKSETRLWSFSAECSSGLSSRIRGCDGSSSNLASSSFQVQTFRFCLIFWKEMYSEMNLQYDLDLPPTK